VYSKKNGRKESDFLLVFKKFILFAFLKVYQFLFGFDSPWGGEVAG
jgi:hypothetical protein